MSNTPNPLKNYFRTIKAYIRLPSADFDFYKSDVIDYKDQIRKEVGIQPMTALDELALKDPDGLLNGESIKSVIKSCVPNIKDPGKMFINDIQVLLATTRAISMGDELPVSLTCPSCKATDEYTLSLEGLTSRTGQLESEYVVEYEDLKVYVKPFTFDTHLQAMNITFEESKLTKVFEDHERYTDLERIKAISRAINRIGKLNFDQISSSIAKIVMPDGTEIIDQNHIAELIKNVDNRFSKAVEAKTKEISKIGLPDTTEVECRMCQHHWDATIAFNPTDFFTRS